MPDLKELTDIQLLDLIKTNQEPAFKEVYNRYWKHLYAFAYKRVKSREVAEEIVQDFLTNFWANRAKLHIQTSFEGYIYTSVKHLVLNHFAKEARKLVLFENLSMVGNAQDNSTEEVIQLRELRTVIAREVSYLPVKCRSVFELSRMQYKTNKEIANVLGISEKTVEGHLSKAIKRLKVSISLLVIAIVAFCI
ncbi:RNA polymerase sigma-70 factor [Mucilaginibacter terrae]|uniref:RNA polymerase sigma-70 factor n=1 Tax=Mucilaginibacter terrae TaxID=1955052 RepID=UPI00363674E0